MLSVHQSGMLSAAATALLLVGPAPALAVPDGYSTEVFRSNWADIGSQWTYAEGTSYPGGAEHFGTGEIQSYGSSEANIKVSGSNLVITALRDESGAWTSARIESKADFDVVCPAGGKLWVEAKIKLGTEGSTEANSAGIWPAFWMLGSAYRGDYWNWPEVGEIDIMENVNGVGKLWNTVHCGSNPGGPCDETNGVGGGVEMVRSAFHTFAVEVDRTLDAWEQQLITFYMDEQPHFSVTGATIGDEAAWRALAENEKFILLNVAMGGSFPDGVAGSVTPTEATQDGENASMEVEFVAAYTSDGGSAAPPAEGEPAEEPPVAATFEGESRHGGRGSWGGRNGTSNWRDSSRRT